MRFALVFSLLIAIVAVVFALYNPAETEIHIGPNYVLTSPLALVLIVTLLVGVLVGALFSVPSRIRARSRVKSLEKQLAQGGGTTVVEQERVVATTRPAEGAAETERIAAETQRMAADAQRRAAEAERRADDH